MNMKEIASLLFGALLQMWWLLLPPTIMIVIYGIHEKKAERLKKRAMSRN